MNNLALDVKTGLRALAKAPGFTAVVALTLGLAFAVNTVIFSFVNFFVLRPLPIRETESLVRVYATHPSRGAQRVPLSPPDMADVAASVRSFSDVGMLTRTSMNLTGLGEPQRAVTAVASATLLAQWGLRATTGRLFSAAEDVPGAERVAVLAHGFWQRKLGGDPSVVGRSINLDGASHTVIGVMEPAIEIGNLSELDVWVPFARDASGAPRAERSLMVTGRLAPGATLAGAQSELDALARRLEREHPDTNAGWTLRAMPLRESMTGADTWVVLALLALCVGFVLLIAAANVTNLVLARNTTRERETLVRLALGASRGRLVRQGLVEGLLLSLLAGVLGTALAGAAMQLIRAVTFEQFFDLIKLDRDVLTFSVALAAISPLLFALLPALAAARGDLAQALHQNSTRSVGGGSAAWGRRLLATAQLALALVVVVSASLAARSAVALREIPLGFQHPDLLSGRIDLPDVAYPDADAQRAFTSRLELELAALPGSPPIALANQRPVLDGAVSRPIVAEGRPPEREAPLALRVSVSPGYAETLGIPLLAGRALSRADGPESERVALVNRALATRLFADPAPIGRRIKLGLPESDAPWLTIVGTLGDVANPDIDQPPPPTVYLPLAQQPSRALAVFARTRETGPVTDALRGAVARLDGNLVLYDARLIADVLWEELASNRLIAGMFVVFALVALLLASIGLYGVVSYAASRRTAEMGIRMALGASPASVQRLVLRDGAQMLGVGLAIGLALAIAVARATSSILHGVSPTDPATLAGSIFGLLAVGGLASFLPARRAAGLDPIEALRAE